MDDKNSSTSGATEATAHGGAPITLATAGPWPVGRGACQ